MDVKTAREMLAAATAEEPPACQCPGLMGYGRPTHDNPCAWFDTMHSRGMARLKIDELGFKPDTLAALILAVEALSCDRVVMSPCRKVRPEVETWCAACKALAAWEKL